MITYDEFRVRIERGTSKRSYRVIATGPSGEATGVFRLPFTSSELQIFILRIGQTRRGVRKLESPEMELARLFGGRLFDALLTAEVRELYRTSQLQASQADRGLRVTLSLTGAPALLQVPWEYLYDRPRFLVTNTRTPIVRYLDLAKPHRPLEIEPPIRILAMASSPDGYEPLDIAAEKAKLLDAVAKLQQENAVRVDWLEDATLESLDERLGQAEYHVFHFIGHGGFDKAADDGVLLFEDEKGRERRVTGFQLGTILDESRSLRLVVLNACEGARTSLQDPFSGVAATLVEHEIPAVIAMQFEITDEAAITFAGSFYASLAEGLPVDAALATARRRIFASDNDVEWGTPVLFMRVADGRLFDVVGAHVDEEERRRREADEAAEQEEQKALAAARIEEEREAAKTATEDAERLEQDGVERAVAKQAEDERTVREAAEREREAAETAIREREAAEARLREREAAEAAERERQERETAEAAERERQERERQERERQERERQEREAAEAAEAAARERARLDAEAARAEAARRQREAEERAEEELRAARAAAREARERRARRYRQLAVILALGLVGVIAIAVAMGPGQAPTVSVAAGGSPDIIRVTGRGFQAGEVVELRIGSELVATSTVDRDGAFAQDVQVPQGASGVVAAVGRTSARSASSSMSAASEPEGTDPAPPPPAAVPEIVFTSKTVDDDDIYVLNPTTGAIADSLTPDEEDDSFATWSPDRSAVAFARSVGRVDRDLYTVRADGRDPLPLVTGSTDDWFPAWSKDDLIAFVRNTSGGNSTIWVVPLEGEPREVPGLRTDRKNRSPSWSPDGQTIAFWGNADDGGNDDLYTVRPDGTGLERLTTDPLVDRNPTWSPDGTTIAFMSDRDRTRESGAATELADFDLYLRDMATGAVTRVTDNAVLDGNPVWSPDGRQLAFYRAVGKDVHIFVKDLETGEERDLMPDRPGDNRDPNWR